MSDLSTDDAIAICEAWFAHNEAARARSIAVQRLATMARKGDGDAARRGLANIDRAPLVFDGSRLEPAVRRLITEVATGRAAAEDATEYVLAQINRDLREQVAALESREVCTVAHDGDVTTCGYCQRDALRTEIVKLARQKRRLAIGLAFYAKGRHLAGFEDWEGPSGDDNWLCPPQFTEDGDIQNMMVEDGSYGRSVLELVYERKRNARGLRVRAVSTGRATGSDGGSPK